MLLLSTWKLVYEPRSSFYEPGNLFYDPEMDFWVRKIHFRYLEASSEYPKSFRVLRRSFRVRGNKFYEPRSFCGCLTLMTVHQPRCQLLPRDERQHDVGRVRAVVIDGVVGRHLAALLLERLAGVGVDVEAREV